ncbi:MAG: RsmG family class I SAM-dependent methyltransferase [Rhizomicrobium sp.]
MLEPKPADPFGPEDFAAQTGVSRETLARLKAYVGLLRDGNARHNLVSAKSLEDVWRRHVWDSAQLVSYVPPTAATLADMGSGAGFPGLVLAELLRGTVKVSLFESTAKKAEFLRAAATASVSISRSATSGSSPARPRRMTSSPPGRWRRWASSWAMHSIWRANGRFACSSRVNP